MNDNDIGRLQKSNRNWRRKCQRLRKALRTQKAEIEYLEKENMLLIDRNCALAEKGEKAVISLVKSINEVKSEAIKEFAERFGALLADFDDYDTLHIYEIKDRLDLVKEMTENDFKE